MSEVYDPEKEEFERDMMTIDESLRLEESEGLNDVFDNIGEGYSDSQKRISKSSLVQMVTAEFDKRKHTISHDLEERLGNIECDSDDFVTENALIELDSLRVGTETHSMTRELIGTLKKHDVIIAHSMLFDNDKNDSDIADMVGMSKSDLRRYIAGNNHLQEYMQNILNSQKAYENISKIRKIRAIDDAIDDTYELALEEYSENPAKLMKLLLDYKKVLSVQDKGEPSIVINNNSISHDNRSIKVENNEPSGEDEASKHKNKLIADIMKNNEIKI